MQIQLQILEHTHTHTHTHTHIPFFIYNTQHTNLLACFIPAVSMVAFIMSLILTIGQPDNTSCGAGGQREQNVE